MLSPSWPESWLRFTECSAFCRLVTLAAGAAAGKFLKYEENAPTVAAQTAYGIEAVVEGYDELYGGDSMLFMDYRRHHTGLWSGTAPKYAAFDKRIMSIPHHVCP